MPAHPAAPRNRVMQGVLGALKHAQVRILLVDDADTLYRENLEALQLPIEKSTCSILLIGLSGFPGGFDMSLRVTNPVEDPFGARSNEEEA